MLRGCAVVSDDCKNMIAVNVSVQTELTRGVRRARQCIVTLLARSPPQSKSATLTTSLFPRHRLRAHAPPPLDQSVARVKRSEGRAGCCCETERADRGWLWKHRIITTPDLEENRRVSRLSWAQSRSRVASYSRLLTAPCCTRIAQIHACDILRQSGQRCYICSCNYLINFGRS